MILHAIKIAKKKIKAPYLKKKKPYNLKIPFLKDPPPLTTPPFSSSIFLEKYSSLRLYQLVCAAWQTIPALSAVKQ